MIEMLFLLLFMLFHVYGISRATAELSCSLLTLSSHFYDNISDICSRKVKVVAEKRHRFA